MKICPDCKAPNPTRQTECFSCGQSLDKPIAGSPKPGERTYSCANCGRAIPFSANACPGCGRLVSAPPLSTVPVPLPGSEILPGIVALGPAPAGWEIIPLPDGTLQLKRTAWKRLSSEVGLPALCFIFGAMLLVGAFTGHTSVPSAPRMLMVVASFFFTLFGMAAGLWQFVAPEEIRVGPNRLERRKSLMGYQQAWRFTEGAVIRAETRHGTDRSGSYTTRYLKIESLAQRMTLDWHTHRESILRFFGADIVQGDDIAALGRRVDSLLVQKRLTIL
jgi:hypothetical protein